MESVHVSQHPLVQHKVTLLSDERTESRTFRELVRELTRLLLYEATADLPLREIRYPTPMETTTGYHIGARIGMVPIIRAGLGMVEAAVDALPSAQVWHLGMYRDETTHQPVPYYNKLPSECPDDIVLVLDPMLATGGSATDAIGVLKTWGATSIRFVGIIGAPEGIERVIREHPDVPIHLARMDRELNSSRFILPGLGDAGDRLFGTISPEAAL
jgi:uracil phosphoribosyltransferase